MFRAFRSLFGASGRPCQSASEARDRSRCTRGRKRHPMVDAQGRSSRDARFLAPWDERTRSRARRRATKPSTTSTCPRWDRSPSSPTTASASASAVMDVMGMGNAGGGAKRAVLRDRRADPRRRDRRPGHPQHVLSRRAPAQAHRRPAAQARLPTWSSRPSTASAVDLEVGIGHLLPRQAHAALLDLAPAVLVGGDEPGQREEPEPGASGTRTPRHRAVRARRSGPRRP